MRQTPASLILLLLLCLGYHGDVHVCGATIVRESSDSDISSSPTTKRTRLRKRIRRERKQPETRSGTRSNKRREVSLLYQERNPSSTKDTVSIRKRMRKAGALRRRSLREEAGTRRRRRVRGKEEGTNIFIHQVSAGRVHRMGSQKKNTANHDLEAHPPVQGDTRVQQDDASQSLANLLSSSQENTARKKDKKEGFLEDLALVLGGGAVGGGAASAAGLAAVLCTTGVICTLPTDPPSQAPSSAPSNFIFVSNDAIFNFTGLPRAPTDDENDGLEVQLEAWYTEEIRRQLGFSRQAESTQPMFLEYRFTRFNATTTITERQSGFCTFDTSGGTRFGGRFRRRLQVAPSEAPASMPSSQVDQVFIDFAIQRADVQVLVTDFLPRVQPNASVYRSINAGNITIRSTTTPSPSSLPSMAPSSQPSSQPSGQPSSEPSMAPSSQPSSQPSSTPSSSPSSSKAPSSYPSFLPSSSQAPSSYPSFPPSSSQIPSFYPSFLPSSSQIPSVSNFPSSIPTASAAPSVSSSPTAPGPTERVVMARLGYGFFAGTNIREATAEEIDGLVVQTQNFYIDILRAAYPTSFSSFVMSNTVQTFDASANFHIVLDFDSTVTFLTPEGNTPTAVQVFTTIQNANYDIYIMQYVWNSTPTGTIFFDTQRVTFGARGGLLSALIGDPKTWLVAAWIAPSSSPTSLPTAVPSISKKPSNAPSAIPSSFPSMKPSKDPSEAPSAILLSRSDEEENFDFEDSHDSVFEWISDGEA